MSKLFDRSELIQNLTRPCSWRRDIDREVFTSVKVQVEVSWVVKPCNVVVGYQLSRDPCCLHCTLKWRQHEPLKRWHPTTTLHGVITKGLDTSPWRWRQHGPLKRWYPTTTLHSVKTQKISTLHSEDGGSMDLWNVGILPQHYTASHP
jgi:hypothetical protein